MKYRRLGSTDLEVSVVGLGTWQYGGEWGKDYTQAEVDAILDTAGECKINLIDTAECYGPDQLSEKFIGDYLSRRRREDWIVATKFGHSFDGYFKRKQEWSAQDVLTQLEDSLRALKTDYIDLYQFHSGVDEVFFNDELWTMLDKQKQAGKIRHLGISVHNDGNDKQVDSASKVKAEAIQVLYNRLERIPEKHMLESAIKQDLGVLVRVPLASGFLSGKYKPGTVFTENDVRNSRDQKDNEEKLRLVQEIQQNEVPTNVDMAQWALAWCLKHPAVTTVIPGSKNPEQVRSNALAADLIEK
ncbi:aldo/keto reductase [bacterium LRH843]|nr:aldo/keto reductase [bacterium LRH843]